MAFYIIIFAILAVVLIVGVIAVIIPRRRREMGELEGRMHTGTGHTKAPTPAHPAKQKHAAGVAEAGASGRRVPQGGTRPEAQGSCSTAASATPRGPSWRICC